MWEGKVLAERGQLVQGMVQGNALCNRYRFAFPVSSWVMDNNGQRTSSEYQLPLAHDNISVIGPQGFRESAMGDEVTLSMPMPLDSDGFLRRACPTCEREFKWFATPPGSTNAAEPREGGYFCPYCGIQAPPGSWLTEAQVALARNTIAREAMGPMLRDFGRSLESLERNSGGLLKASFDYKDPEKMDPLTEEDDMKRVDFACHPSEPVKVVDDWTDAVYCLICGDRSSLAS